MPGGGGHDDGVGFGDPVDGQETDGPLVRPHAEDHPGLQLLSRKRAIGAVSSLLSQLSGVCAVPSGSTEPVVSNMTSRRLALV